ncbi:hypothetical protein AAFF_G00411680 [Aldrovandia affinis]|uniref:Uncharacterized protein n=1 Tax=Aldrovandia affinis TaxID=143900 RepID=A0AAD7SDM4_9TELE|nr:hypothetical protein AAFF_G00411680 [Aldrovandia affinis]
MARYAEPLHKLVAEVNGRQKSLVTRGDDTLQGENMLESLQWFWNWCDSGVIFGETDSCYLTTCEYRKSSTVPVLIKKAPDICDKQRVLAK